MHSEKIENYTKKKKTADLAGGQDRIAAQHEKGKLTARERIDLLLDEGTFTEVDALTTHHYHEFDMQKKKFFGDGVVCGYGMIDGRKIFVFAYDFTVLGGISVPMKKANPKIKVSMSGDSDFSEPPRQHYMAKA